MTGINPLFIVYAARLLLLKSEINLFIIETINLNPTTKIIMLNKKIIPTKYNDQKEITTRTVFRHFSNTFQFFPFFKVISIKPWQVEALHNELNCHEIDDILDEWKALKEVK